MINKEMILEAAESIKVKDIEKHWQSDAKKFIKQADQNSRVVLWKAEDGNVSNVMHALKPKEDAKQIDQFLKVGFKKLVK